MLLHSFQYEFTKKDRSVIPSFTVSPLDLIVIFSTKCNKNSDFVQKLFKMITFVPQNGTTTTQN